MTDPIDVLIAEAEAHLVAVAQARLARTHANALPRIKKLAQERARADYARHRDALVTELDSHLRAGGDAEQFFTGLPR